MASASSTRLPADDWLGLLRPVGLVVAPAVLSALQLVPNQSTAYLSGRRLQLEGLLEEVEGQNGQPLAAVPGFQLLATVPEALLAAYGETLRPSPGVPKFEGGRPAGPGARPHGSWPMGPRLRRQLEPHRPRLGRHAAATLRAAAEGNGDPHRAAVQPQPAAADSCTAG